MKDILSKYSKEVLIDFITDKLGGLSEQDKITLDFFQSRNKVSDKTQNVVDVQLKKPETIIKVTNFIQPESSISLEKIDHNELENLGKKTYNLYQNFLKLENESKDLILKIKKEKDLTIKKNLDNKLQIYGVKMDLAWQAYQHASKEYSALIEQV